MNKPTHYYQVQRAEVVSLLPEHYSCVLEIGCGAGAFRRNLNQQHEYWGVEPVTSIAEIAKGNLTKVLVGTYKEVEHMIPSNYFDLIVCNDVIEHTPDHDEFFQSIKEKLRKDGSLVASIPNVRYVGNLWELLVKKDWEYKDWGILDKTHLRFFTRKSLLRTRDKNAFLVEQITGLNRFRPPSLPSRIIYWFALLLLGQDIKFLQFGIRIKDAQASDESFQPICKGGG